MKIRIFLIPFSKGENHVVAVGNFAVASRTAVLSFPVTGQWFDYFAKTTYRVNETQQSVSTDCLFRTSCR
jgi:hypothetical protein